MTDLRAATRCLALPLVNPARASRALCLGPPGLTHALRRDSMRLMNDQTVQPGEIIAGKYRVDRFLGMGGMGVVMAATHLGLAQAVAIKLLLSRRGNERDVHERFLREARAAVRLKSEHVARVIDVGTLESGAPYMVMELLQGRDLGALIKTEPKIFVEDAVEYVLQTCEAIGEAHAAGIIHRDLKPANLFLTKTPGGLPCVKVLDFGVSKHTGADIALTKESEALGSPLYMSPEQMQASKDVDARSDIWALGVILYELLASTTPFHAEGMPQLCTRIFMGEPTPIDSLRSGVPSGLWAVIRQCIEKDRERRFRNVAELAAALAPYAPSRAVPYVERTATILGVDVSPARSTDDLPEQSIAPLVPIAPPAVPSVSADRGLTTVVSRPTTRTRASTAAMISVLTLVLIAVAIGVAWVVRATAALPPPGATTLPSSVAPTLPVPPTSTATATPSSTPTITPSTAETALPRPSARPSPSAPSPNKAPASGYGGPRK